MRSISSNSGKTVVAEVDSETLPRPGDRVGPTFDEAKAHVFGADLRIQAILDGHGVDGDGCVNVRQSTIAGIVFERKDRVAMASDLVRKIVKGEV
ncbi:hypothetical protein [Rhizobium bangladeshense]|uniref:hypothetical protein n=1 Tax=Rhizobium bangladeshense TaxID=1138189 RepID=UPI000A8754CC|nr:hypothetical protein [Rhizobium bangladeshense]